MVKRMVSVADRRLRHLGNLVGHLAEWHIHRLKVSKPALQILFGQCRQQLGLCRVDPSRAQVMSPEGLFAPLVSIIYRMFSTAHMQNVPQDPGLEIQLQNALLFANTVPSACFCGEI